MDQFFLQISELNRAGWSLQIFPESIAETMPAVRAAVIWSRENDKSGLLAEESPMYPLIDWINKPARCATTAQHSVCAKSRSALDRYFLAFPLGMPTPSPRDP